MQRKPMAMRRVPIGAYVEPDPMPFPTATPAPTPDHGDPPAAAELPTTHLGLLAGILEAIEHLSILVGAQRSRGAETSKVSADVTPKGLLETRLNRHGAAIYNDSSSVLYVKLGAKAASDDWTVKLAQDDYYELPAGYVGHVSGVWVTATGQARITELT